MQTTRIFLGSSEELRDDRLALADFMNSVNAAYVPQGKQFLLVKWEHESIAIARQVAGKQAEYNDLVRGSDLCLFLFHTRCGEYTMQEVKAALAERAYTNGARPRVIVWVRELATNERRLPELEAMLYRVDRGELPLAYREYCDVRTVALDLLDQLEAFGATITPRRVGDFVYLNDEPVLDVGASER